MSLSVFWEMTLTACITVWSPGPNNIFLLSSASRYGVKKNVKFMMGIWTGSLSLMLMSGIFMRRPGLLSVLCRVLLPDLSY